MPDALLQPDAIDRDSRKVTTSDGTADPLLLNAAMPLRKTFFPLGFPIEITTNSKQVLDAADESWGEFDKTYDYPPLQLRIGVTSGGETECPPGPQCRVQQHLLSLIADADNFSVCDLAQGFAYAWLTDAAVGHTSYFRYHFLESSALFLLTTKHVTAIHAACVAKAGKGVLLCGQSGAGKSSLSFACAHAGWTYVSDDAIYLLNDGKNRNAIGNSKRVRFRPSAAELFPELQGRDLTPRAAGKPSIELPIVPFSQLNTASEAAIDYIVFLNREGTIPHQLVPFSKEAAREYMQETLFCSGEARAISEDTIERILSAEIYELHYRDLDWAVNRLDELVRERR